MRIFILHPSAFILPLLLLLSGCGKDWTAPPTAAATPPQTTLPRLPIRQAIAASESRINTYRVLEGDRSDGTISHTTIPWDMETATWRTYESGGGHVQFRLLPDAGYALTEMHSPRNAATILFDQPLILAPAEIPFREPHTHTATFQGWARGWSPRRGTITVTTEFLGLEDTTVPIGTFIECAIVQAHIRITLPYGLSLTIDHRQWLHPAVGDVRREVHGRLAWAGLGVRRYHRVLELIKTEPLDAMKRQEMIGEG